MSPVDRLWAPAKLTRALRVVGVRADGYHLLEAEMATLDLADELEIEEGAEGFEIVDEVAWVGGAGPRRDDHTDEPARLSALVPPGSENLVGRALAAAGRRARVRLVKRVPAGAGLGGGSSDAAAVLRWAGVADPGVAARLGADVPFCVVGGRALVSGIGELVEPLGFEAFTAVLVTPALPVSTPEVYLAWDSLGGPHEEHGNDLEPAALVVEPRLAWWRDLVAAVAGERPSLAGSGGTWYVARDPGMAGDLVAQLKGAVRAERGRAVVVAAASTPRH
ncbi:MAG TPA: 4-(cytidine 5'-diphospho)-2-C-methyl-D-erythritol kinase [Acidimicrobiales bacterium]|nr:4-(cytidine 5'-diphospho)-2-C-methyl-D-erythritol kinase [Acidimicrobiales bacterium]